MNDLSTAGLTPLIQQLAAASRSVIMGYYRGSYQSELKADDSPVTIADRETELLLRRLIQERFPNHGILGEEFGHHQPEAEYQWILDPIDGTKNFMANGYIFATLIALTRNGQPILGMIHHTVTDDLLIGDNAQTTLNGRPVQMRPCAELSQALLIATEHWPIWRYQNGPAFESLARQVREYRGWGGCHGYYLLATGGADIMLDPEMKPWDFLPMIPIIRGAGGVITDWQGNDPVAGTSLVAASGAIHEQVIRVLNA